MSAHDANASPGISEAPEMSSQPDSQLPDDQTQPNFHPQLGPQPSPLQPQYQPHHQPQTYHQLQHALQPHHQPHALPQPPASVTAPAPGQEYAPGAALNVLPLSCTSEDKRGGEGIGSHRPPQWPSERFPVVIPDLPAIDENVVVRLAVDVSEIRAADRQRRREVYEKSKRKQGQGDGGGDGKGKWKQAMGGEEVEAIKRMEEFERLTARYLNDTRVEMVAAKTVVKQLVSHTGQTQSDLVRLLDDMMRHPAGSDGWARRAWYGIFWRSGGPRARVKRQVEKALSILDAALAASDEFIGQGDGHENRFANLAGLCRVSHQKELSMKRDAQATVARQKRGEVADRQRALNRVREGSPKAKLMENRLIQLREQVQAHEKAVAKGEGLRAAKGKALCDVSEEVSAEFRDLLARVKKDQDCRKKVSRVLLRLGEDVKSWAAAMPAEDMRRTEEELRDGVEAYLGLLGTLWRGNRKEVDRLCRW